MPVMEFFLLEVKMLERRSALRMVPCIAEQHTADVPENGANGRQGSSSAIKKMLEKSVAETPEEGWLQFGFGKQRALFGGPPLPLGLME